VLDIGDYPATNRIREEFFAGFDAPASTLVEVSGFVRPDVQVEIECTAAIPEK
jgi:enamine deaminase RidA (YjgF/YER057c/UK114 family)